MIMTNKGRILSYPLALLSVLLIFTISCKKSSVIPPQETVTDADGNVYHSVTIGTQVWLVENLTTTKYSNGEPIPNVTDATDWSNLTGGAYCNKITILAFQQPTGDCTIGSLLMTQENSLLKAGMLQPMQSGQHL